MMGTTPPASLSRGIKPFLAKIDLVKFSEILANLTETFSEFDLVKSYRTGQKGPLVPPVRATLRGNVYRGELWGALWWPRGIVGAGAGYTLWSAQGMVHDELTSAWPAEGVRLGSPWPPCRVAADSGISRMVLGVADCCGWVLVSWVLIPGYWCEG